MDGIWLGGRSGLGECRTFWITVPFEQAIRCQLSQKDAGEFIIQASIVHLAGVAVDYEEFDSSRRPATMLFSPQALIATKFVPANLPQLLTEARAQLQETLAIVQPYTMAA
jgi:hypothetical protein